MLGSRCAAPPLPVHLLGNALDGRCAVFSSDLKVRIEATNFSTFPDAVVVCGPVTTSPIDAHAVVNPTVVVEVTSPSTEDYDRGDKLSRYKQLPSLRAVLFVSHRARRVTVVERAGSTFSERDVRGGETVVLSDPALAIGVDAIYEGVTLDRA